MIFIDLFVLSLSLALGNFLYQYWNDELYMVAFERTFFQWVAIFAVYIRLKVEKLIKDNK